MNARTDRFYLLDSLRGMAALGVIAVHTSWIAGAADGDGWDRAYTARVEPAIAVFFLISGFLIYRPFVKARLLDRPALSVRAYGWRRVLRAVPAFWVALTLIAVSVGPDIVGVRSGLRNYLFLQLYHHGGTDAVIPQAWTLSVEIAFYVTLPLWVWLMRRLPARDFRGRFRGEVLGTSALVAGSLAYSAILAYSGATDPITFTPDSVLSALPGYMGHIGMGMLLAVVSVGVERRGVALLPRPLAFLSRHPGLCWAGAIAAAATLTLHDVYTPGQYVLRHVTNIVVAVAFAIPAVFGDFRQGLVRRLANNRVLAYFGLISYGLYLYHWAVLQQLLSWRMHGDLGFMSSYATWLAVSLLATVVLGSLSYYLVERPALSLKRLVPLQPGREPDEALAEPAPVAPVTATPAS